MKQEEVGGRGGGVGVVAQRVNAAIVTTIKAL